MKLIDQQIKQFAHIHWADNEAVRALKEAGITGGKPLSLLGHIAAAEKVWLGRINGSEGAPYPVWPEIGLAECERLLAENKQGYDDLLGRLTDERLTETIEYRTSMGTEFRTSVIDILTHVFLHGSYHRGQIAMLLRNEGADPLITDYILFVR
ncbi:DinB family protein [Paenibacillus arenilitoris]|uniref:DinB family protein n=1 Tax=Paenibacillus arenilitoris TaxID=2772299 RepID=A0A927H7L2_9BACL|nr:DinB family protein [Paenibacillus arenilitoris]MBD2871145.1 DinB family protein [Paenibacillus arenilitoris]